MPNSDKPKSRFYGFVVAYYKNDPYTMLDKFSYEIAEIASSVSIDWESTKSNVDLGGNKVSGRHVIGLTKADAGRMWVIGFENTHTWSIEGESYTIKFPCIRFQNFRKHFPEPVLFNGYNALMEEFERYKSGERVKRLKPDLSKRNEYLKKVDLLKGEELKAKSEAIEKDAHWLSILTQLTSPCPYFSSKGVDDLYQWVDLYTGSTSLGPNTGVFTAIKLVNIDSGVFRGLQRIYPETGNKIFRKGLDPSGACFTIPARLPVNGEPIFVLEAPADAGVAYKLTGFFSVAAMFADNIPLVLKLLRESCPDSDLIMIADNDQYGGPNKGVDVCESALMSTEGICYLVIPTFGPDEKLLKYKDLSDFNKAYGDEITKRLVLSYS
ncbi:hypothetical protein G3489_19360 [Shewanella baltica]|uniref:hypothetical protein n=1 Tax=Shewanella baltica TaxID=62322 RepID=UPI00217CC21A|nr:hypothetical protein [Shewanella baltica]MCS6271835.1 hypothetical protein [Shewanella baltica]